MSDNKQDLKNPEFSNIQEKVKQRPLNRKKLLRRTIITASMAVIFGVLACITFLVLEPYFSNILHPEEEPEMIEIPKDNDEILPEDMMLEEEEKEQEPTIQIIEKAEDIDPIALYRDQYTDLNKVAATVQNSMVKVTSVNKDTDWFDNAYENKGSAPGLYIANNTKELLILCSSDILKNAEQIKVTLYDGTVAEATVKGSDTNTGLSIVAVSLDTLRPDIIDDLVPVTLGNSRVSSIVATPVIALGHPYGNTDSVGYGILTAKGVSLNMTDKNYELLMTDIYGSSEARGIITNLRGEVLGIIDQSYNSNDTKNLISAIGISEIKKTIERMSNGRQCAYLGITGTDVTDEAHTLSGVPIGAYVTGIVMDSPAMDAGIQSGDVIVKMGETEILSFSDLTEYIESVTPDNLVSINLLRQSGEEYREITMEVTLEEMP